MQARQEAEGAATGAEHIPTRISATSWHCVRCGVRAKAWQDLAARACDSVQAGSPEAQQVADLAHEALDRALAFPAATLGHALVEAPPS